MYVGRNVPEWHSLSQKFMCWFIFVSNQIELCIRVPFWQDFQIISYSIFALLPVTVSYSQYSHIKFVFAICIHVAFPIWNGNMHFRCEASEICVYFVCYLYFWVVTWWRLAFISYHIYISDSVTASLMKNISLRLFGECVMWKYLYEI